MTGALMDTSLTIDTYHYILSDFFWQETENAQAPSEGIGQAIALALAKRAHR